MIGLIYEVEADIRKHKRKRSGENKRLHRLEHAKSLVEQFFAWVDERLASQGLLPSNALTKALAYARERKAQLMVLLGDEAVPMDTNHLERALRPIGVLMDALASIHPVPAAWLRDSVLAPYMPAYWRDLRQRGYAGNTARAYVHCVAHFARWIRCRRLAVDELEDGVVQRWLKWARAQ